MRLLKLLLHPPHSYILHQLAAPRNCGHLLTFYFLQSAIPCLLRLVINVAIDELVKKINAVAICGVTIIGSSFVGEIDKTSSMLFLMGRSSLVIARERLHETTFVLEALASKLCNKHNKQVMAVGAQFNRKDECFGFILGFIQLDNQAIGKSLEYND